MLRLNRELTETQRQYCEYWLRIWSRLERRLALDPKVFNITALEIMIQYELETRRRPSILNRIVGRRAKMVRKQEWDQVQLYLEKAGKPKALASIYSEGVQNAGIQDRELSRQESRGDGREGVEVHVV